MPASNQLLFGVNVSNRQPSIIDLQSMRGIAALFSIASSQWSAAYTADGSKLLIGSDSPFLTVLNTDTWTDVAGAASATGVTGAVYGIAVSHSGARIALAHANGTRLKVVDSATFTPVATMPTLAGTANAVAWSPDDSLLAIAHNTSPYVTILETATWTNVGTGFGVSVTGIGRGVAFRPSGAQLAVAHTTAPYLSVFNVADWTKRTDTPAMGSTGYSVDWSPDGSRLAVGHADVASGNLAIIDAATWAAETGTLALGGTAYAVAYNKIDGRLAVGHAGLPNGRILTEDGTAVLFNHPHLASQSQAIAWSPAPAAKTLSGTVVDIADAPIARPVLALHDATGQIVATGMSDAGTGAYTLTTPYSDGHTVLMREASGKMRVLGAGIIPL